MDRGKKNRHYKARKRAREAFAAGRAWLKSLKTASGPIPAFFAGMEMFVHYDARPVLYTVEWSLPPGLLFRKEPLEAVTPTTRQANLQYWQCGRYRVRAYVERGQERRALKWAHQEFITRWGVLPCWI